MWGNQIGFKVIINLIQYIRFRLVQFIHLISFYLIFYIAHHLPSPCSIFLYPNVLKFYPCHLSQNLFNLHPNYLWRQPELFCQHLFSESKLNCESYIYFELSRLRLNDTTISTHHRLDDIEHHVPLGISDISNDLQ